ncbi:MAG: CHAT domain-containing protein [Leptolyngbyaceae cyanobacterium]
MPALNQVFWVSKQVSLSLPVFLALLLTPQATNALNDIVEAQVQKDIASRLNSLYSFSVGANRFGIGADSILNGLEARTVSDDFGLLAQGSSEAGDPGQETRVLIVEVAVTDPEGELLDGTLEDVVFDAISTEAGGTTTRSQLQRDINNIFAIGIFANVRALPEDTPLGPRITFEVQPNPVLTQVEVTGNEALPDEVVDEIFSDQYGEIIDLIAFQDRIVELNEWYQENGYVLAQVIASPEISPYGVVTLVVAEGVIEDIQIRYISEEGLAEDENGNPIQGWTREFIITRELETQAGDIFQQDQIQSDLQRVFGLGLFDDINLSLEPGADNPRNVTMVINVVERNTETTSGGVGFNLSGAPFLTFSYAQENLRGLNQDFSIETQVGSQESFLKLSLISPGGRDTRLLQNNSLLQSARAALQHHFSGEPENAIDQYLVLLDFYTENNLEIEEALTRNNLSLAYSSQGRHSSSIENLNKAKAVFQDLGEPVLELLTWLKIADSYRQLGNPQKTLENYYGTLEVFRFFRNTTNWQLAFGEGGHNFLRQEWHVWDSRDQLYELLLLASHLFEAATLLDMTSTYSSLGDYQQAIYMVNSPQLNESLSSFSENAEMMTNQFVGEWASKRDSDNGDSSEDADPFLDLSIDFKDTLLSTIKDLPNSSRLLALSFISSDLYEEEIAGIYLKQASLLVNKKIGNFVSNLSGSFSHFYQRVTGSNSIELLRITENYTRALSLIFATDISSHSAGEPAEDVGALDDRRVLSELYSELIGFLDESGILGDSESAANFSAWLDINGPNLIDLFYASRETNQNESHRVTRISEDILQEWPEEDILFKKIGWLRGFILKMQGDAYSKEGEYLNAISSYLSAIENLSKAPTSAEELMEEIADITDILEIPNYSYFEGENEFLASLLEGYVEAAPKVQRLDAMLSLARLYLENNQPLEAEGLYVDSLALHSEINKSFSYLERAEKAEIYYGLARAEQIQGNIESAISYVKEGISLSEYSFPLNSLSGGSGFLSVNMLYGYGIPSHGRLGGRFEISPKNPWSELTRSGFSFDERPCSSTIDYFSCRQKYFGLYIDLLMAQYQKDPSSGFDILALEASERARSLGIDALRNIAVEADIEDLEPSQDLLPIENLASLSEIQDYALEEDVLVLEYFLGEEKSYLWVLQKGYPLQTFELDSRENIEAKAKEFYEFLTLPSGRVRPQSTEATGQELSKMLLGPISGQLGQKRLIIVADGFLQYLPFSALPNPAPETSPSDNALAGEYAPVYAPLLLEHEIIHQPSLSALVNLRQNVSSRPEPTKELAFFANPVFNHKDDRVEQVKIAEGFEPFSPENLENVEVLYSELPETEQELEEIISGNLIPADKVQNFFGYDADLESALSPEIGQFRIVHFASHGIFNSNAPERSGIVLSSFNEEGVIQPGLLSPAYAFNEMDLSATELVVLSGCRTGLSQGLIGREGMTGLTNGLFDAGAERVVASLWSVRDDATRELMNRFYQRMFDPEDPMRPAEALRDAQISMWNEPRWQTPYNWAAFTLQGEWR